MIPFAPFLPRLSMHLSRRILPAFLALAFVVALAACADVPNDPAARAEFEATNDPLEPMNRAIFDVNDFLDRLLFRPLAELYRVTIPPGIRDRLEHVLSNFKEPVVFANNLMQGEFTNAGITLSRLALNSTAGVAGIWDVSTDWGLPQQKGDFGQTLYSWGLGSGPYLVLPLFGPSNIRDAVGLGADSVMSPWQYLAAMNGVGSENRLNGFYFLADGVVQREENIEPLDALREGSLDFYAQMRSVYRQYRDKQLGRQSTEGMPNFDDF
jgi:phospholipid-binding lipoprotein MlaA